MRCHYEMLGVSQRATDGELKKAYYKMALQWHPDKNPDNLEEAKQQFQLIQAAYDTLSDPQERAFYDRNRDSILRGKSTTSEAKPDDLDMFKYFSSQCYSGFNDSEKGFYTVYRRVFEKLATMDMQYMDDEEDISIPNFGRSDTDLEDVASFFAYWSNYCSSMDFRWADEYDIREAQRMGRWVEKKIEKDNSKARQKARKQFNEEVRELVAFVRKRDKRWQARKKMMEAKIAENAEKQKASQQKQRERHQQSLQESMEQEQVKYAAYEEQLRMLEEKFAEDWGSEGSEEEEEEPEEVGEQPEEDEEEEEEEVVMDDLYCVACNKAFKTEKSMDNHRRSKKHKENEEQLIATMTAEDQLLFRTQQESNNSLAGEEQPTSRSQKKKKKKNRQSSTQTEAEDTSTSRGGRGKKKKSLQEEPSGEVNGAVSGEDVVGGEQEGGGEGEDGTKEGQEGTEKESKTEAEEDTSAGGRGKEKGKTKGKKSKEGKRPGQEHPAGDSEPKESRCEVCGNVFPSKNKLFQHIKTDGHAALKTDMRDTREAKSKKGRKKIS